MELTLLEAVESGEKTEIERREPSAPALIPGWRCLPQAIIRLRGEEGFVDLAALNAERGVALIALLDAGEEASPEEASAAFRAMLEETGFHERFPGELPVVAWAQRRAEAEQLTAAVERRFSPLPRPSLPEGWVDWLAEHLATAPAAEEPPRLQLVAPPRDEPPPPAAGDALLAPERDEPPPAGDVLLAAERDEPAPAVEPAAVESPVEDAAVIAAERRSGWLEWGASLGFAFGVMLALAAGAMLVLHSGRF